MNRCLLISKTTGVIILSICLFLISSYRVSISAPFQLNSGEYVSTKYLEVLEKTLSPFTADGGRSINMVVVQKVQEMTEVLPIIDFHEGGPTFLVDQSGMVEIGDKAGFDVSSYKVQIINSNELLVGFDHFPLEKYIFTKDLQRFIRNKCMAGRYLDREGRLYNFESNGIATTPNKEFRFTVGIDHVPYRFDYIEDSETHQIYRFVKKKCNLEIYKVLDAIENQHGNDGSQVVPFASLHEVGCKAE